MAISSNISSLDNIGQLKGVLIERIREASEAIKNYNPDDYTAFAMLQSLLTEISENFPILPANTSKNPPATEIHQPRHSG